MAYTLLQGVDTPKDPYSGAVPTLSIEQAEVNAGQMYQISGSLTVANAATGAVSLNVPAEAAATVTVDMTNSNADMTYTANTNGAGGNSISVTHVDPSGNNEPLTVTRVGNDITISLKTGAAGAIESTAAEVAAAVNADAEIARVLTASAEGTGEGVVNAKGKENLAGGVDEIETHLKIVGVAVSDGPMTAKLGENYTFTGGDATTPINLNRVSDGTSQNTCVTNAGATVTESTGDNTIIDEILLAAATPSQNRLVTVAGKTVLKQGLKYVVSVLNSVGTEQTVNYRVQWFERVFDNFRSF